MLSGPAGTLVGAGELAFSDLRYRWKVGATRMPRDLPSSLFSLLQLNLTTLTLSPSSWDICSRWGSITLHGPHLHATTVWFWCEMGFFG